MLEQSELAWRLRVAACSIIVCLGPVHITGISTVLSQRLRNKPMDPAAYHHWAISFDIIRLVHVLVVVVTIIVLLVIASFMTLDLGNSTSAVGVYGTLLWVS